MNVIELTRALIDIESITNNEERIGNFLFECLAQLAAKYDGHVERVEVEPRRFNLFAQRGRTCQWPALVGGGRWGGRSRRGPAAARFWFGGGGGRPPGPGGPPPPPPR